ncbi:hypothetical protein PAAG_11329 [Paracoccidioides lutzii Pb01]|uniref:Uncharacterized protein n=1 Tax=Paracoccidioides lutzii (strain ATCC MYA-826 / Pb01) TaxID=502779 RepID=A0A0A2V364_PARBA|nr:hypothetical protein PAAG_11329 [Paracoccidioides lutzii Pb01]KGQ01938.1 hypothetical protein PAAG_11329 [Paracoccidioides lutzii Pb01]
MPKGALINLPIPNSCYSEGGIRTYKRCISAGMLPGTQVSAWKAFCRGWRLPLRHPGPSCESRVDPKQIGRCFFQLREQYNGTDNPLASVIRRFDKSKNIYTSINPEIEARFNHSDSEADHQFCCS